MKTGADLQQTSKASAQFHIAFAGIGDAGDDFEQCALSRAIPPNHAQALTFRHIEIQIAQCPEAFSPAHLLIVLALQRVPWLAGFAQQKFPEILGAERGA